MLRDLYNSTSPSSSIDPIAATTTVTGTGVDMAGYSAADIVIAVGAPAATLSGSIKATFTIEESDESGSGYATVAAADLLGTAPLVDANGEAEQVYHVGYIGSKRYVRVVATLAGDHAGGTPISATVVRAYPRQGVGTVA